MLGLNCQTQRAQTMSSHLQKVLGASKSTTIELKTVTDSGEREGMTEKAHDGTLWSIEMSIRLRYRLYYLHTLQSKLI